MRVHNERQAALLRMEGEKGQAYVPFQQAAAARDRVAELRRKYAELLGHAELATPRDRYNVLLKRWNESHSNLTLAEQAELATLAMDLNINSECFGVYWPGNEASRHERREANARRHRELATGFKEPPPESEQPATRTQGFREHVGDQV